MTDTSDERIKLPFSVYHSLISHVSTHTRTSTPPSPLQLSATSLVFLAGAVGIVWAYSQFTIIAKIPVESNSGSSESQPLTGSGNDAEKTARLQEIYEAIYEGAESFLRAEYKVCFWFISVFSIIVLVLVSWGTGWDAARGVFTALSFLLGAITSMGSGYLGMVKTVLT